MTDGRPRDTSSDPAWTLIDTVLCDLDGVVWLAHRPIPGSVEAVARLRASGRRVIFVTNNSAATRAAHEEALAAIGIDALGDVVSSSMAAARLVEPTHRVLVTGGDGVVEAFAARGVTVVRNDGRPLDAPVDAVVVGLDRHFDYDRLAVATAAIHAGAMLIGTNTDSTYPTPQGLLPGGGSILAAIATASGATPIVGGKPNQPMAELIGELLAPTDRPFDPRRVVMVGDRPETDGLFAARLGCRFALVHTGVPASDASLARAHVDLDVVDLAAVAGILIPRSRLEE